MMKPGIRISKVWFDDDLVELKIDASDGTSLFSNMVYIDHQSLPSLVSDLTIFREHIYGGLLDVRFGEFGPEYAYGAFHARLHFPRPGKLFITCKMESTYEDFSIRHVASEATLYLKTEPILLDNFIAELKLLNSGEREDAYFETI